MLDDPHNGKEEEVYFYHSDHLGSAAYLTYHGGVIQTLNYLPYGEDWVEYNFFHPDDTTRLGQYTFNGKEKDYESGFHYYGARYYWSEVLTGWLSVDPMADKYPSISPYAYCAWNPVKLVDPDGMEFDPTTEKKYIKPYENELKERMSKINNLKNTAKWDDRYEDQYQEYQNILDEISSLRDDKKNIYSVKIGVNLGKNIQGRVDYKGVNDDGKRKIQINLSTKSDNPSFFMSALSHELKHTYQYYDGLLGFYLNKEGTQVSSNNCQDFERAAFRRGDMFSDPLLTKGGLNLKIYDLNPNTYTFQPGTKYLKMPEHGDIINIPPGFSFIRNNK